MSDDQGVPRAIGWPLATPYDLSGLDAVAIDGVEAGMVSASPDVGGHGSWLARMWEPVLDRWNTQGTVSSLALVPDTDTETGTAGVAKLPRALASTDQGVVVLT